MNHLIDKLRTRRTGEWSLAYIVGAAATYQVLSEVGQNFLWRPAVLQLITVLLAAGLPIVVVVSWYHGERGRQRVCASEVTWLVGIFAATAVVGAIVVGTDTPDGAGADVPAVAATGAAPSSVELPGVVVFPLELMNSGEQDSRMAEVLHEELINRLTLSGLIAPANRQSVVRAIESDMPLTDVAALFGASHTVTGTWRVVGDTVRVIAVQLSEAGAGRNVWTGSYRVEGEMLSDEMLWDIEQTAQAVAAIVVRDLSGGELPESTPTALDPAAHRAYMDGLYWITQRTRAGLSRAIASFVEAIEADEDFAGAYAALSNALVLWVTYDYRGLDHYEAYSWANVLSERAISLGPGTPDAHLARGFLLSKAWAPADRAEAEFALAVARKPGSADVLGWYAYYLARERRFQESLDAALRAIQLDPLNPGRYVGYAFDALGARRPDLVLEKTAEVIEFKPELEMPRVQRALALLLLERADECLEVELIDREKYRAVEAMCLYTLGRVEEAAELAEALVRDVGENGYPPYIEAYHAWTGDVVGTFRWMERSYERSPNGPDFRIIQSGLFDPVREVAELDAHVTGIRGAAWDRVSGFAESIDMSLTSIQALAASTSRAADGP